MTGDPPTATPAGRRLLFAGLYFAEGAPIGFVWWALPVWLRSGGASPGEIARVLALATWPWTLKFLWAPLVDLLRTPRFGLRGWIVSSQVFMALALAPLLVLDLTRDRGLVLLLLVLHGLAAATQDAAIDTLAVRSVPSGERGAINGWMQVGMLAARALFGGGAVLLAARIGQQAVVALLVVSILCLAVLAVLGVHDSFDASPRRERLARYRSAFGRMLRRRELWGGFLLASIAGAGFEGLASLAGPLLLDRGADTDLVGFFFLVPAVVLMAAGALAGGRAADRFGRRRLTLLGEAVAAATVIAIGCLAWSLPVASGPNLFLPLLGLLYFAAGVATAALYTLLMEISDPEVAATQFCAFMAGINLCYVWSAPTLGWLVDVVGYGPGIVVLGLVSLLSLPLLLPLTRA